MDQKREQSTLETDVAAIYFIPIIIEFFLINNTQFGELDKMQCYRL